MQALIRRKSNPTLVLVISILLVAGSGANLIIHGGKDFSLLQILPLVLGLIILTAWFKVRSAFAKSYHSNPRLQHPIVYEFDADGIGISGHGFSGRFDWSSVQKTIAINDFVLLYLSPRAAEIVRRSALTDSQLAAIEGKVSSGAVAGAAQGTDGTTPP